jgi:hypothetical protein
MLVAHQARDKRDIPPFRVHAGRESIRTFPGSFAVTPPHVDLPYSSV